ncbi:GNAT family N-acetyltransferase [Nakamurella sp. A5-74]|uniref:GNAT family N-acetyltransferase n=1 Tax=Nakamurella sp. A5-74 TaxID=3158264 RepID=A0AAU8DUE1_9ACTN
MDRAALIAEFEGDPFIECEIRPGAAVHSSGRWRLAQRVGHLRGAGWVLLDAEGTPFGPTTASPSDLAQAESLIRRPDVLRGPVTTDRGVWDALAPRFPDTERGGEWDWMWTGDAPVDHPQEAHLVELDDCDDAAELEALNRADSPTAESQPGTGLTELWIGARVPGPSGPRIVAAGALHRTPSGAPHLAGIVTASTARGQGWGTAVVRALTRRALVRPGPVTGICTLGMYAGNDSARRLYHGLGFITSRTFASHRPA